MSRIQFFSWRQLHTSDKREEDESEENKRTRQAASMLPVMAKDTGQMAGLSNMTSAMYTSATIKSNVKNSDECIHLGAGEWAQDNDAVTFRQRWYGCKGVHASRYWLQCNDSIRTGMPGAPWRFSGGATAAGCSARPGDI